MSPIAGSSCVPTHILPDHSDAIASNTTYWGNALFGLLHVRDCLWRAGREVMELAEPMKLAA